jgi:hypothetical protein
MRRMQIKAAKLGIALATILLAGSGTLTHAISAIQFARR